MYMHGVCWQLLLTGSPIYLVGPFSRERRVPSHKGRGAFTACLRPTHPQPGHGWLQTVNWRFILVGCRYTTPMVYKKQLANSYQNLYGLNVGKKIASLQSWKWPPTVSPLQPTNKEGRYMDCLGQAGKMTEEKSRKQSVVIWNFWPKHDTKLFYIF